MKWAWMEGVTYRDWAKYHELKGRFDEWEKHLEELIVAQPGLQEAETAGQAIEDGGMDIARSAAKELARLKEVGGWKIQALDASDEFDSELMRAAAEAASNGPAAEPADETEPLNIVPSAEATAAGGWSIVESISEEVSRFSEETPLASLESLASQAGSALGIATDLAASVAQHVLAPDASETTVAKAAGGDSPSETVGELASEASSAILQETPKIGENSTEQSESDASHLSLAPPVEETTEPEIPEAPDAEDVADESATAEDGADEPAPAPGVASSIKPALFGVAAESVPTRQPVMEEDSNGAAANLLSSVQSDLPSAVSSMAMSAYSTALSRADQQYARALRFLASQAQTTKAPEHEQMLARELASVTLAYSRRRESVSAQLERAFKAAGAIYSSASSQVAPTPTKAPLVDWARVEAVASDQLVQGRSWAEEQFESAKVAMGLATPTPTSPVEKLLEGAKYHYYAALGAHHARYSEFIAAASSALSSLTATPTPTDMAGTISSMASVAGASVSSAASAASENVASAAGAAGNAIVENWEAAISQLSVEIYGAPTPTPWYESWASAAGGYAAAATDASAKARPRSRRPSRPMPLPHQTTPPRSTLPSAAWSRSCSSARSRRSPKAFTPGCKQPSRPAPHRWLASLTQ